MAPELILFGILLLGINFYALFGGADFGAGVWEFITALRAPTKERDFLYAALGPVWEANHVWLIFALVILFTAYPKAFADISTALWLPLLLALTGIVFRGAAFAFRSHALGALRAQALWSAVFAIASTAAPFFLGAAAGTIASGRLNPPATGREFVVGWINPLSLFSAFFGVGICVYLSAVFLTREARHHRKTGLEEVWRRRALLTGAGMGILSLVGVALIAIDADILWQGFRNRSWPAVGIAVVAGLVSLGTLWTRRYTLAAVSSAGAITAVIWAWGVGQYPYLIPPHLTVMMSKAPDQTLWFVVYASVFGSLLLIPSLAYLFYLFKFRRST